MHSLEQRLGAYPEHRLHLASGELSYRDAGQGVPVVFLHGIGSSAASWVHQFDGLRANYRCIAWDAPGYGWSKPLPERAHAVGDYVAVLRELLQALSIDRYHLVAHSLGALVAGAHCQIDAHLPASLTFIDATLGYGALQPLECAEKCQRRLQTFERLGADGLAMERAPALLSVNASPEALEIVRYSMARLSNPGYSHAVDMLAGTSLLDVVGLIDIPVFVMCGTQDQVTPEALNQDLAEAYDTAEYIPLVGLGHASYVEGYEIVNNVLLERFAMIDATAAESLMES